MDDLGLLLEAGCCFIDQKLAAEGRSIAAEDSREDAVMIRRRVAVPGDGERPIDQIGDRGIRLGPGGRFIGQCFRSERLAVLIEHPKEDPLAVAIASPIPGDDEVPVRQSAQSRFRLYAIECLIDAKLAALGISVGIKPAAKDPFAVASPSSEPNRDKPAIGLSDDIGHALNAARRFTHAEFIPKGNTFRIEHATKNPSRIARSHSAPKHDVSAARQGRRHDVSPNDGFRLIDLRFFAYRRPRRIETSHQDILPLMRLNPGREVFAVFPPRDGGLGRMAFRRFVDVKLRIHRQSHTQQAAVLKHLGGKRGPLMFPPSLVCGLTREVIEEVSKDS